MNALDLIFLGIYPACKWIEKYSPSAIALLAGTASVETNCGERLIHHSFNHENDLDSFTGGLGIFQQQYSDHEDIINNFFDSNKKLLIMTNSWCNIFDSKRLVTDLIYASIFCRLHYLRVIEPLPNYDDIEGLAKYWNNYYNLNKDNKGHERFISSYFQVKESVEKFIQIVEKK